MKDQKDERGEAMPTYKRKPRVGMMGCVQLAENVKSSLERLAVRPHLEIYVTRRQDPGYRCSTRMPNLHARKTLADPSLVFRKRSRRFVRNELGWEKSQVRHVSDLDPLVHTVRSSQMACR